MYVKSCVIPKEIPDNMVPSFIDQSTVSHINLPTTTSQAITAYIHRLLRVGASVKNLNSAAKGH